MNSLLWMNFHIKPNLKEGQDYLILSKEVYDFLLKKYSIYKGHEIKRFGISVGDESLGEGILEVYFRPINFVVVPNNLTKFDSVKTIFVSRS